MERTTDVQIDNHEHTSHLGAWEDVIEMSRLVYILSFSGLGWWSKNKEMYCDANMSNKIGLPTPFFLKKIHIKYD
jgi:hypothetical protein